MFMGLATDDDQAPATGELLLVRLHAVSDAVLACALFLIPVILVFVVLKRRDLPFPRIFVAFGVFLMVAATQHLMNVWALWYSDYWLAGMLKGLVAVIAVATLVSLVRIAPAILRMPTRTDLRRLNDELDERVRERTAELTAANDRLAGEIRQRQEAEAEVRRLNASLEQRVAELQTLFEFIPIGVGISTDADGRHIQMNPALAVILGVPPDPHVPLTGTEQPLPANCRMLHRGEELAAHQLPMQAAARANAPVLDFEVTIVRPDGSAIDVLVSAVPLRDRAGNVRGCVATFQDITQRKRNEQERLEFERKLQATQKLESLGVLSGGIAHDFNNLLTGVIGHANLARFSLLPGQDAIAHALDQIEHSGQRAADLCRQLLAYAGKGRFHVQPLNLSHLVEEMSHLLVLSIARKARLDLQLVPDLPAFMGDATQVRQVVMNLVINAAEAIPAERAPGTILLKTARVRTEDRAGGEDEPPEPPPPGGYVEFEITDNGTGMTPEVQARLFEPFFTTKFTGRGLGLAAVQGIMRSHQGSIDLRSEPGHGTTFRLRFPVAPDAVPAASSIPAPTNVHWQGSGAALVIDDEETVREVARHGLEKLGFSVVVARDGVEGLQRFRDSGPFALVLLDLTMPRLDGENTLRALHEADPELPVMLMSGFNEQMTVERFVGRGLAGFLPKPFTVQLLARRVREALTPAAR